MKYKYIPSPFIPKPHGIVSVTLSLSVQIVGDLGRNRWIQTVTAYTRRDGKVFVTTATAGTVSFQRFLNIDAASEYILSRYGNLPRVESACL